MKSYLFKMAMVILISSSIIIGFKNHNEEKKIVENISTTNILYKNDTSYSRYLETAIVYEGLTLEELANKLDLVLNSDLKGYGKTIATIALEYDVDPVVATSIILVETGCKWNCSSLVTNSHNVGGMRGQNGYLKFANLEEGIEAFINNLSTNYYQKGLDTPEKINRKYATNPNWYKDVYYYVNIIMG